MTISVIVEAIAMAAAWATAGYVAGIIRERLRADKRHADQIAAARKTRDEALTKNEELKLEICWLKREYPFDIKPWTGPVPEQVPHVTVTHQGPVFPIDPCEDDV